MNISRPTTILAAFSLGLFVIALFATGNGGHDTIVTGGEGETFLLGFIGGAPEVSIITISAGDEVVTLNHTDGIWRVGEKGNYPADGFRVQMLVNGLSRSLKIKARTNDPNYFDRVGLGDAARTISFENADGDNVTTLQLGDQFMSPAGLGVLTFAWDDISERVWTISELPEVSTDPTFWVEADVLQLSQFRVKRVSVTLAGTEPYAVERQAPEAANFSPLQPMGGIFNQEAINELGYALSEIFLEDVALAETGELFHVADTKYETFDGLVIEISLYDNEGIIWVSFSASYNAAALEEEGTPSVMPDAPADGTAEATRLNALWAGHIFQLPIEQISKILKRKQDLVR